MLEGQKRNDVREVRVQRIRLRDASDEDLMHLSENLGLSLNADAVPVVAYSRNDALKQIARMLHALR